MTTSLHLAEGSSGLDLGLEISSSHPPEEGGVLSSVPKFAQFVPKATRFLHIPT